MLCLIEIRKTEMAHMGFGSKPGMDLKSSKDNINDRFVNVSLGSRASKSESNLNYLPRVLF